MNRYQRQIQLPQIGEAGQEKLARSRVLVVGAGGLGSPVLSYLAGAGVGEIVIVDPDVLEVSNLHRQVLFEEADVGSPKVEAAARAIERLNSAVLVTARQMALNADNAPPLIEAVDLVVDAADGFAVSYTLSDLCRMQNIPLISGSVIGLEGYAGGFCAGAPSLRALFPEPPRSSADCTSEGVLGPVVGTIGAVQAQMALAVLLGLAPSPLGRLLRFDASAWRFSDIDFRGAAEPGGAAPFIGPSGLDGCARILDLRSKTETVEAVCQRAEQVTLDQLSNLAIDPSVRIALCCRSGLRAWRGAEILKARGFKHVFLFAAGASS